MTKPLSIKGVASFPPVPLFLFLSLSLFMCIWIVFLSLSPCFCYRLSFSLCLAFIHYKVTLSLQFCNIQSWFWYTHTSTYTQGLSLLCATNDGEMLMSGMMWEVETFKSLLTAPEYLRRCSSLWKGWNMQTVSGDQVVDDMYAHTTLTNCITCQGHSRFHHHCTHTYALFKMIDSVAENSALLWI